MFYKQKDEIQTRIFKGKSSTTRNFSQCTVSMAMASITTWWSIFLFRAPQFHRVFPEYATNQSDGSRWRGFSGNPLISMTSPNPLLPTATKQNFPSFVQGDFRVVQSDLLNWWRHQGFFIFREILIFYDLISWKQFAKFELNSRQQQRIEWLPWQRRP